MGFADKQVKVLNAKLMAKHVKTRVEEGVTLSYVEGWHVIAEANRIFGFGELLEARPLDHRGNAFRYFGGHDRPERDDRLGRALTLG